MNEGEFPYLVYSLLGLCPESCFEALSLEINSFRNYLFHSNDIIINDSFTLALFILHVNLLEFYTKPESPTVNQAHNFTDVVTEARIIAIVCDRADTRTLNLCSFPYPF